MKSYRVTCLNCKGSNVAIVIRNGDEYIIDLNTDHRKDPNNIHIISARYRGDMQFGWECGSCGNTSIIARQEFPQIKELIINGGPSAIQKITNSLKVNDDKKFKMAEI